MQTHQGGHLSAADRSDPGVAAYLTAVATVRRLEAELSDARAIADAAAAAMDTRGEARGRLGRVAREIGMEEQSLNNQRQRGKNPRRAVPKAIRGRVLTPSEYATALRRAHAEANQADHEAPGPILDAIASGVLAALGLLAPPPEPTGTTCTARWPGPDGQWRQCQKEPHDAGLHNAGEWGWGDDDPNAIPARP